MFVPGADNTIIMIRIRDHRIVREEMVMLDLSHEIEEGSWVDDAMDHRENHLTAIMPDAEGNIWFTSKFGAVGMLLVDRRFNEQKRHIELDPAWEPTYAEGHLFYDNDRKVKPGHNDWQITAVDFHLGHLKRADVRLLT